MQMLVTSTEQTNLNGTSYNVTLHVERTSTIPVETELH